MTQSEIELGTAHIWLTELEDREFDHLVLLLGEYGPSLRHVARGIQIARNAPGRLKSDVAA